VPQCYVICTLFCAVFISFGVKHSTKLDGNTLKHSVLTIISVCLHPCLSMLHAYRICPMRHISSPVACPASAYFSTLSHTRHNFRKKKAIKPKMCYDFLQTLSETDLIRRRTQRDIFVINVSRSSRKVSVIVIY
jgi:hypothetical protein